MSVCDLGGVGSLVLLHFLLLKFAKREHSMDPTKNGNMKNLFPYRCSFLPNLYPSPFSKSIFTNSHHPTHETTKLARRTRLDGHRHEHGRLRVQSSGSC